jgi:hypothetical protein
LAAGVLLYMMGRQRAGKDTAADYLVHYYGFKKAALAAPVYEIGRGLFGMTGKDRGLLIQIGLKMREIDPMVFPKALWRKLTAQADLSAPLPADARVVVTDARFPNELEFFRAHGGIGVRIVASQQVRSRRPGYDAEYECDRTETGLDEIAADVVIANEGTYGQFFDALDAFAKSIGLQRM